MDLLNLAGDERLDLGDLTFATNEVPAGLVNELTGNFLVAPGATAVVTGLRPSGSGQGPVQVGDSGTPNVAFLGQRLNGVVTQGVLTLAGPATQQVSVSSLPANTYGIFVRFNRLPGQSQTRKFWAKAAPGQEYSQLHSTRLVATWEARVEVSAPSAEWVKIGQVVVTSAGSGQGSTITVTDQRTLYFEGPVSGGYAPAWGSAADRSADRSAANTGNLQRQLDALRQCIVDIKGRGLQPWYAPTIGGLLVGGGFGLSDAPSNNRICVGDRLLYLDLTGDTATLNLGGTVGAGAIRYNRTSQSLGLTTGLGYVNLSANGSLLVGSYFVSPTAAMLGVQSHQPYVSEMSSDSASGTYLTLSSKDTDAGGSLYFRRYNTSPDPAASNWFWRARGYANTNQILFSIDGFNTQAGQSYTPMSALMARSSGGGQTLTTLGGDIITLDTGRLNVGANVVVNGRPTASGGAVFAAGYVSAMNFNPSSISVPDGCSVTGRNTGTFTLTFSGVSLPNPATVCVTPMGGDDGRCRGVRVNQNGNSLNVTMRNDNAESSLVDFSIVVFWGGS